jgi:aspartate-semialdehyde dehydrogenase
MNAFVLGATGIVGKKLVTSLLENPAYKTITLFSRRELPDLTDPKITQQIIPDFQSFSYADMSKFDVAFCCMGTTRAIAGSTEKFIEVFLV